MSTDISRAGAGQSLDGLKALAGASPEAAIKFAYDFGRRVRIDGAAEADLPALLAAHVDTPLADSASLTYVRAGFIAGFTFASLPWRRDVDAAGPWQQGGGSEDRRPPRK